MILRLIAVALFDLPQTVILPGQHLVRVGFQRALVPDLRELVVAEFAIGIADQVGHVRVIVVAERLQLLDRGGIVVAVVDRCIGCAVTLTKCGVIEAGLLGLLELVGGFGARPLRVSRRRRRVGRGRVGRRGRFSTTATATAASSREGRGGRGAQRHQKCCQRPKPDHSFDHSSLLLSYAGDPSSCECRPRFARNIPPEKILASARSRTTIADAGDPRCQSNISSMSWNGFEGVWARGEARVYFTRGV